MIFIIRLERMLLVLGVIAILIIVSLFTHSYYTKSVATVALDPEQTKTIEIEVQKLIAGRNKALLVQDKGVLASYYNRNTRNGLWAYEYELNKMNYLHRWAEKQSVTFKGIEAHIVVKRAKAKGEGYTLNLIVSTQYQYIYNDTPQEVNTFRIGTHHSLDLMPIDEKLLITKEWYADPLSGSFKLGSDTAQEMQKIIVNETRRDLSDLNARRIQAIEYADQYCGAASLPEYGFKYNTQYVNQNFQGGDCANFASQILFEGGGFKKTSSWNYNRGEGSRAWLNAHGFNSFMINSGRASVIAKGTYDKVLQSSYKLLPGDYIAYEKKGKVAHISVVTGLDSKGYPLVNAHNADRYRVPWDIGWNGSGIKFWLVRVHY